MALIIGIDVGGTHADGVLLDGERILVKNKVPVDQANLSESILILLKTLVPESGQPLSRIHLSTTLCTNSVINNTLDTVGMFIQSGPGMNPDFLDCGEHVAFLDGAVDHRGHRLKDPDESQISEAVERFKKRSIKSIGIVTKFSQRNNCHEVMVRDRLENRFAHVSLGHRISGLPNFPRRVYTTWLNAALKSRFVEFREAISRGLKDLGIDAPCSILKADGGTMPFGAASSVPCETVLSGPSASVMGCLALEKGKDDAILLDIGGTTTDIAILAEGVPLLEPYGVTVTGRPTLIRALNTKSVGLGGDSAVRNSEDGFSIGPDRLGTPMCLGGTTPTPTDAMVVLGTLEAGSAVKAEEAMKQLAPDQDAAITAEQIMAEFVGKIQQAVEMMIEDVFSRPVFTVAALLGRKRIEPSRIIAVGGPALAMRKNLADQFGLPCTIPEHFEVANAIGAARTRPTMQATLYADTADGTLSIPETGCQEVISRGFTMQDAKEKLREAVAAMAGETGLGTVLNIDFLEVQEMNTVRGFSTSGKIMSLKAQVQPGLEQL
ncbi:hydantoinase/oxoprolinase family protein [Desulfopila sp. IMCC35008]|uniref:hydantoinase/oxoprolinase family protein n=1 Tax=Desulfopila sp. IMCC35008 TaxID=2653858 RepID=UPI0013D4672A|nr:hydantoinase/oxoprolinase family protein [Desulfopila sp. IMCC35008]